MCVCVCVCHHISPQLFPPAPPLPIPTASSSSPSESGPRFLAIAEMVLCALVEAWFCFSAAMKVAVRSAWSTVSNLPAGHRMGGIEWVGKCV